MKIPEGMTEKEVLKTIDAVVNQLASSFRFGYHDEDDLKQEGRLEAIKVLATEKFDPSKKLYNFLYSHIRWRYINFKRDKYSRNEPPCYICPFYDPKREKSTNQCAAFADKFECDKWSKWHKRNNTKQNLNRPVDISELNVDGTKNVQYSQDLNDKLFNNQLLELINQKLPAHMRSDYLRFMQGSKLSKNRLDKLKIVLKDIVYNADN